MASITVQLHVERRGRTYVLFLNDRQVSTIDITECAAIEEEDVPRVVALLDELEVRATGMPPKKDETPC